MKLSLTLALALICQFINAQTIFTGNKTDIDLKTRLVNIPSIQVTDKSGKMDKLPDYIRKNSLHDNAATLLISWRGYASQNEILNKLAASTIADQYNVVVLYVNDGESAKPIKENLAKRIADSKSATGWGKFMMVAANETDVENNFYTSSSPALFYAGKDMKIFVIGGFVSAERSLSVLNNINDGLYKRNRFWYNDKNEMVPESSSEAERYEEYKIQGNTILYTQGTHSGQTGSGNYILKNGEYLVNGTYETFTPSGQKIITGEFREGVPLTTVKGWYPDGKIKFVYPLNGTAKSFDENGKITMEGPLEKGLGNGLFTGYSGDKKTYEYQYVEGKLNGLQKEYDKNEKISREFFAHPDFQGYNSLKEGLQLTMKDGKLGYLDRNGKFVIAPVYDQANDFYNDRAMVRKGNLTYYINRGGRRLIKNELRYRPRPSVMLPVYKSKKEIVEFLEAGLKNAIIKSYGSSAITKISSSSIEVKAGYTHFSIDLENLVDVNYFYKNNISKGLTDARIEFIGLTREGSENSTEYRTEATLQIDESVKLNHIWHLTENIKQLARLNGAKLIDDLETSPNKEEIISSLQKITHAAVGKKSDNLKITGIEFSGNTYKYNYISPKLGASWSETTILDWGGMEYCFFEAPEKSNDLYDFNIVFLEKESVTTKYNHSPASSSGQFGIYLEKGDLLKAISAVYLLRNAHLE